VPHDDEDTSCIAFNMLTVLNVMIICKKTVTVCLEIETLYLAGYAKENDEKTQL
jgi:hypothetical protein